MKLIKKMFFIILMLAILIVTGIFFYGYILYNDAIKEAALTDKVEELRKQENYITISDIPKDLQNAVVAIEDHRFYTHYGIDIITTARSMFQNIVEKDIVAGGSTISQQLGRVFYFTQEQRFTRKVAELFVSFDLEKNYSKDEILELYLNSIYYGNGYYGIKEASMGYYQKLPKDLSTSECAMLAGIPNAPSVYNPSKNPTLAKQRQKKVIEAMAKYDYLDETKKTSILQEI